MSTSPAAPEIDASTLPELRLKPREDRRLTAGHLWVFSNEVDTAQTPLTAFQPGALCRVVGSGGRFLGYAYVNPHALICARIVARDPGYVPGKSLIVHRLQVALALRERLHAEPYYRLVHGESDGLPGLVLDRFGDIVVAQAGTAGIEALKADVVAALQKVIAPRTIVWKNDSSARELEGLPRYVETVGPEVRETVVPENGVRFLVPVGAGQKTGWFYDQAANRRGLLKYVAGRRVLDVFSYLGAWGLAAAKAGASEVLCVDSSAPALELLQRTAEANGLGQVRTQRGDAFDVLSRLRAAGEKFDVVVVDPPAFIKRRKDVAKGQAAYRKLNQLAMQVLARDAILVSCSCSHHLALDDLVHAVQQSARHLDRFAQVLEVGGQAPDHPIHPAIPETRYLKSLFCRVVHD